MNKITYFIIYLSTLSCSTLNAQREGQIITEKFHSKSLEKTLTRESSERVISIYLPPSYSSNTSKSYPVIYLLHGIGGTDQDWVKAWATGQRYQTIKSVMDEGIEAGKFGEMIVVMPDHMTNWFGSFYTNSEVTGNWEDFTVIELVRYVDQNYRTRSDRESRGIAGHSMGGYGALILAMKNPKTYSSVYALSPAIIDFTSDLSSDNPIYKNAYVATSFNELRKGGDLRTMAVVTVGQAFSPNPKNPPFYIDFPFKKHGSKMIPDEPGYSKWKAKSPEALVSQFKQNLSELKSIALDVGDQDEFRFIILNSKTFSKLLRQRGIKHSFEEYKGDHRNKIWGEKGRLSKKVFPYFWEQFKH